MRSARRPASPRKWVREHDRAPVLGRERADQVDDVAGRGRVEARGRLVEEQHLGVVEQRPGQGEALALPGRGALHQLVGPVGHPERSSSSSVRRADPRAVEAAHAAGEREVLAGGQALVEAGVLGEHAGAAADLVAVRRRDRARARWRARGRGRGCR